MTTETEVKQAELAAKQKEAQRKGMLEVARIVKNAQQLVEGLDIKGKDSKGVAEVLGWLEGVLANVQNEAANLEEKKEPMKLEIIKPEAPVVA